MNGIAARSLITMPATGPAPSAARAVSIRLVHSGPSAGTAWLTMRRTLAIPKRRRPTIQRIPPSQIAIRTAAGSPKRRAMLDASPPVGVAAFDPSLSTERSAAPVSPAAAVFAKGADSEPSGVRADVSAAGLASSPTDTGLVRPSVSRAVVRSGSSSRHGIHVVVGSRSSPATERLHTRWRAAAGARARSRVRPTARRMSSEPFVSTPVMNGRRATASRSWEIAVMVELMA